MGAETRQHQHFSFPSRGLSVAWEGIWFIGLSQVESSLLFSFREGTEIMMYQNPGAGCILSRLHRTHPQGGVLGSTQ